MKRLILIVFLATLPFLQQRLCGKEAYGVGDVPNTYATDRSHHVSDPDGLLRVETVQEMNRILSLLEDSSGIQSMVVMLPSIGGEDVFDFAHSLFRHWGLGDKERNDGLLILYVQDQRKIRFTTGYGLEGVMPDAVCKRIQQRYMLPYFRDGNTDSGMLEGVKAVSRTLQGNTEGGAYEGEEDPEAWQVLLILLGILLSAVVPIWLIHRQAHTCPRCGRTGALKSVTATSYRAPDGRKHLRQTLRCSNCGHTVTKDSVVDDDDSFTGGMFMGGAMLGGRGMRGVGGGFSGGFFGGGSTGGGGATSGW